VHATLILIEHLHLFGVETRFIQEVRRGEALIEGVAGDEIPEPYLHKRAQVAGRPVSEVHHAAGLAVDHEDVTFANVCGFHGSGNLNLEP